MNIIVNADVNIADKLQEHFEPLKIISFSNCCRIGCTGNYGESDFELREILKFAKLVKKKREQ